MNAQLTRPDQINVKGKKKNERPNTVKKSPSVNVNKEFSAESQRNSKNGYQSRYE